MSFEGIGKDFVLMAHRSKKALKAFSGGSFWTYDAGTKFPSHRKLGTNWELHVLLLGVCQKIERPAIKVNLVIASGVVLKIVSVPTFDIAIHCSQPIEMTLLFLLISPKTKNFKQNDKTINQKRLFNSYLHRFYLKPDRPWSKPHYAGNRQWLLADVPR